MRAPARRSTAKTAHDAFDADGHSPYGVLLPGERIGQPLARTGGKAMLRGVFILITLGGGWALLGGQVTVPGWLADIVALAMDRGVPGPVERAMSVATSPSPAKTNAATRPTALDALPPIQQS